MSSPPPPPPIQGAGSTTLGTLTDDLLREIFIRLNSPADLARSSAACSSFRRVITDYSFLRRSPALRSLPLLGILDAGYIPAEPPHPSAPAALAVLHATDMSCSFLPSPETWRRRDTRDGRILFSRYPASTDDSIDSKGREKVLRELVVCDPLSGRYALLPTIPQCQTAIVEGKGFLDFEPLLAPAAADQDATSFRVMYMALSEAHLVAFVFSPEAGQWRAVVFDGWAALMKEASIMLIDLSDHFHAHGCIYWFSDWGGKVLMLDTCTMELSILDEILYCEKQYVAIVEAEESKLGMFILFEDVDGEGRSGLTYCIWQNNADGVKHWQPMKEIMLPLCFAYYNVIGTGGGYVIVQGIPGPAASISSSGSEVLNHVCFSVDIKTFQLQRFCAVEYRIYRIKDAGLFASFPPSLSPPSI